MTTSSEVELVELVSLDSMPDAGTSESVELVTLAGGTISPVALAYPNTSIPEIDR